MTKADEIEKIIEKSKRALDSSKRDIVSGSFDFASSRAYYAVFYLLEAVLLIDEKSFSKHSGVISNFNHDYVKSGIFPVWVSKYIKTLLKRRELSDYSFSIEISKDEAEESLEMARRILKEISSYIKKKSPFIE